MRYTKIWLLALLTLLIACNEDEQVTYNLETDAYMRGVKLDGKAVYAPVLLAKSSSKTASLTALDGTSTKYTLEPYWNNDLVYRWVPFTKDYKAEPMQNSTFNFKAMPEDSDKASTASESIALSDVPKPFEITAFNLDKEKSEITLTWENAAADNYLIQIAEKLDAYPVFQSASLVPGNKEATTDLTTTITRSSFKWFKRTLVAGQKYVLSVHAFNLSTSNSSKIDGEFIATKEFTWGK